MNKYILSLTLTLFCFLNVFAQTNSFPPNGNAGIGTITPLAGTANEGLHINKGGHSTILLGDPIQGNTGGFLQVSDDRYRLYLGTNLYDDVALNWRAVQPSKGAAGISLYADEGNWGTGIGFYLSQDGSIKERMTLVGNGNVGIGATNPQSQFHVASDLSHAIQLSRSNGTYGFRIHRDASAGIIRMQIGTTLDNIWETKIQIGEGEGPNTRLLLNPQGGNVEIGSLAPYAKLSVNGEVFARKVKVAQSGWPDFVFENTYVLPALQQVEAFIKKNKHLPEIPSAREIEKEGLDVGQQQAKLLQKIEELTLYLIEQNKKIADQQLLLVEQDKRLKLLESARR